MSFSGFAAPGAALPGIYRLVSPSLATGAKTGSLSDNITFVTNIPSLDFALRIWRIRYLTGFAAYVTSGAATAVDVQYFAQLTENQTKTSVLGTDTSYLDSLFLHYMADTTASAVVSSGFMPGEVIHDFSPINTPFTVATKLNFVVTMANNGANNLNAGTIWKPTVTMEYTLERLTPDLRDYLSKRLQIQGS